MSAIEIKQVMKQKFPKKSEDEISDAFRKVNMGMTQDQRDAKDYRQKIIAGMSEILQESLNEDVSSEELKRYSKEYGHYNVGDIIVDKNNIWKIIVSSAWIYFILSNVNTNKQIKVKAEDMKDYGKHISKKDSEYKKFIKPKKMSYAEWNKIRDKRIASKEYDKSTGSRKDIEPIKEAKVKDYYHVERYGRFQFYVEDAEGGDETGPFETEDEAKKECDKRNKKWAKHIGQVSESNIDKLLEKIKIRFS